MLCYELNNFKYCIHIVFSLTPYSIGSLKYYNKFIFQGYVTSALTITLTLTQTNKNKRNESGVKGILIRYNLDYSVIN